jgi:arabinofuranosyltransferase
MSGRARALAAALLFVALAALASNAWHYYPFIADDSFISLRYAERLIEGHGLTWTAGEPVEGYTNLLWTLLCAALGAAGVDLVLASRILGLLGMGAAVAAVFWAVRPRHAREAAAAAVGMFGLALSGPAGAWAVGGLEQPLVAGLLAWALVASAPLLEPGPSPPPRKFVAPGLLLALLALARADGAALAGALCAGVALLRGPRRGGVKAALALALPTLVAVLGQLAFRRIYYHAWVPNTALAKVAFTPERLRTGGTYLLQAALPSAPLLALGALSIFARTPGPRQRQARLASLVALAWAAYVGLIGGDIFPAHRHWIPVLVGASMSAALGLCLWAESRPMRARPGLLVASGLVAAFGALQYRDRQNRRALSERWEYNGEVVGRLLRRAFGDREPLLAAATVGSLCYYAKLPSLDMYGLNDRHLARHRPEGFGTGFIGHELGDGAYALRRRPDLVIFTGPTGRLTPGSRGETEMFNAPEFAREYQMVHFRGTDPFEVVARVWVRRSGKVGVETAPSKVTVPGYLLSAPDTPLADLDNRGQIGLRLPEGGSARVDLSLPPGRWRLRAEADAGEALALSITSAAGPATAPPGAELAFPLDAVSESPTTDVPLRVEARATARAHVRRLVFERAPAEPGPPPLCDKPARHDRGARRRPGPPLVDATPTLAGLFARAGAAMNESRESLHAWSLTMAVLSLGAMGGWLLAPNLLSPAAMVAAYAALTLGTLGYLFVRIGGYERWADRVTASRVLLGILLYAAYAFEPRPAWWKVGVALLIITLDGVDGRLARRFGPTERGGVFDMESDAFFLITMCGVASAHLGVTPWVFVVGALRPLYVCAWAVLKHFVSPPSPNRKGPRRARTVHVAVVFALIVALAPLVPLGAKNAVVGVAVALICYSYAIDVAPLFRAPRLRPS